MERDQLFPGSSSSLGFRLKSVQSVSHGQTPQLKGRQAELGELSLPQDGDHDCYSETRWAGDPQPTVEPVP